MEKGIATNHTNLTNFCIGSLGFSRDFRCSGSSGVRFVRFVPVAVQFFGSPAKPAGLSDILA
jgi:hypothetical protein